MTAFFDHFLNFDLKIFEWIQTINSNAFLTPVLKIITTLGEGGIIFILMGLILLVTKKYRKIGFAMLVALVVMVVCNDFILKELFARPRPFNLEYDWWNEIYKYPEIVSRPDSWSFPSGHTSSAFAAAVAVLWYNRKIGIPTFIFAAIMGFSRIYVQVHYPSDVIAGAIVGIIYGMIGILVVKLVYPTFEKLLDKVLTKFNLKKANNE